MSRRSLSPYSLVLVSLLLALASPLLAGPPSSATIDFGRPSAGSPFPPDSGHDASTHAKDSMVPRTVVISVGGSVTFNVAPIHRVAIYDVGKSVDDILANLEDGDAQLVDLVFPFGIPNFSVDDPEDRLALSSADLSVLSPVPTQWTTPAGLFDLPGRYLVVCTTAPHLLDNDMFGWVIVK